MEHRVIAKKSTYYSWWKSLKSIKQQLKFDFPADDDDMVI